MIADRIAIKNWGSFRQAYSDYGLKENMLVQVSENLAIKVVGDVQNVQDVVRSKDSFKIKDNLKIIYFDIVNSRFYRLVEDTSGNYIRYVYTPIDLVTSSNMVSVTDTENLTVILNEIRDAVDSVLEFIPSKFSVTTESTSWGVDVGGRSGVSETWYASGQMKFVKNIAEALQPHYKELDSADTVFSYYQAPQDGTYKLCLDIASDITVVGFETLEIAIAKYEDVAGVDTLEILTSSTVSLQDNLQDTNLNLSTVVELTEDDQIIVCVKGASNGLAVYKGSFNFHGYHIYNPTDIQTALILSLVEAGVGTISEEGVGLEVVEEEN